MHKETRIVRWSKKITSLSSLFKKDGQAQCLTRSEQEFLPAALEIVETPPSPLGRILVWFIIFIFTIAILWACIGQVDEVAVAPGKVIPSGYTKTIQAEDKGVVNKIYVKDGSKVQSGELLMELDTTFTAADLTRLTKEQAYYQLEIKRLLAEQSDQPFLIENELAVAPQDAQFQLQLYNSRQAAFKTKLSAGRQTVEQAQSAVYSSQATKEKLTMQLEIATEQEEKMLKLVEQGATSQFQYQAYREKQITLKQDLAAQNSELSKAQHVLLESMETVSNIMSERDKDIIAKLVEDRRQLQGIEEEIKKAKEKHRLSKIIAPISGTVQQLAIHTVGAVVTSAQALMLIVPEGEQMEIEAWVANKDIGFMFAGQAAEIKVETFNFQKYGTLSGKLVEISSDAIEDKDKGLVYRAILRTDQDHFELANMRQVYLTPGMAVTAEIKTRQKRIIEYFMDPFLKYRSEGLRER